jgi:hypothetical protein
MHQEDNLYEWGDELCDKRPGGGKHQFRSTEEPLVQDYVDKQGEGVGYPQRICVHCGTHKLCGETLSVPFNQLSPAVQRTARARSGNPVQV